jgi:hypothetical protein
MNLPRPQKGGANFLGRMCGMGLVGGKIKFQISNFKIKNEELEAGVGGGFLNFSGGGGCGIYFLFLARKANFKFQISN